MVGKASAREGIQPHPESFEETAPGPEEKNTPKNGKIRDLK